MWLGSGCGGVGPEGVTLNGISSKGTPKTLAVSSANISSVFPERVALSAKRPTDDLLTQRAASRTGANQRCG